MQKPYYGADTLSSIPLLLLSWPQHPNWPPRVPKPERYLRALLDNHKVTPLTLLRKPLICPGMAFTIQGNLKYYPSTNVSTITGRQAYFLACGHQWPLAALQAIATLGKRFEDATVTF